MTPSSKTTKLKELHLVKENGMYYLSAKYEIVEGNYQYVLEVPRIFLPLRNEPTISETCLGVDWEQEHLINLGFGELQMTKIKDHYYTVTTIQEELTLEEIEKRLGYKVKIVTKK